MLTAKQKQDVVDHVNMTWKTKKCPMCGKRDWKVEGVVRLLINDYPSTSALCTEDPVPLTLPSAAFVCGKCGNTLLINLVLAGLAKGG